MEYTATTPPSISKRNTLMPMKASDHLEALARGIERWVDFADCCLTGDGPAGVVRRGQSERARVLREEAASWSSDVKSNPFDVVVPLAVSRLELSTRHAAATARLLMKEPMTTSASVMARAWLESSARSLWLIDSSVGAREMVGRALADWLEEHRHLRRLRASTASLAAHFGKRQESKSPSVGDIVDEMTSQIGIDVKRTATGEISGLKNFSYLSTFDLLSKVGDSPSLPVLPMVTRMMYRRSSAAAHGNFAAWGEAIGFRRKDGELDFASVSMFSGDVLSTLDLHVRALRSWNSLIDWSPQDVMDEAERVSLSNVMLAGLEISQAERRIAAARTGAPSS